MQGDVWAESTVMGFLWHYYSCMDSKIYDITEWASCQVGAELINIHHFIFAFNRRSISNT